MRKAATLLLALCACGESSEVAPAETEGSTSMDATTSTTGTTGTSTSSDTKPWAEETTGDPNTSSTTATTTTTTTDGAETGTTGDDAEPEEDFIGWTGFGAVEPGVSYVPDGEIIVFTGGQDQCIVSWQGTAQPSMDCTACEFAFTITIDAFEVEIEQGTACADNGIDTTTLQGSTFSVGLESPEILQLDQGQGFAPAPQGYAEVFDGVARHSA